MSCRNFKVIRAPKYLARGHVFRGLYYLWLDIFLSDYSCCSVFRFGCSPRNGVSVCALLFPPTLCIRSVIDKRRTIVYNVMFHVLSCVRTPPPPGKFNLTLHSKTENMHRQTQISLCDYDLKKNVYNCSSLGKYFILNYFAILNDQHSLLVGFFFLFRKKIRVLNSTDNLIIK